MSESGVYKVLVSANLFESLADRVEWGEPDEEGFYTPTLHSGKVTAAIELGLAWQEAEAALPEGQIALNRRVQPDGPHDLYVARAYTRGSAYLDTGSGAVPAEALRNLAAKLADAK